MRFAPARVLVSLLVVLALLASGTGCTRRNQPTIDAILNTMKAVPGVTNATIKITPFNIITGYHFTITLTDNPTADTLEQAVTAYNNGVPQLDGKVEADILWTNGPQQRKLWINSKDNQYLAPTEPVRAMAT